MNVIKRLKRCIAKANYVQDERQGKDVEVGIHFDLTKVDLKVLHKIENLLDEIGISFDRGAGLDERDWEWDWSLKGPVFVTFRRFKDNSLNIPVKELDEKINETSSVKEEDRIKALREDSGKEDTKRYEFVAYLYSSGYKWETLVLKDNKFKDYEFTDYMNGRSRGFGPIEATSLGQVDKWIEKYVRMNKEYNKISLKVYKGE